jgi:hypothetical protein
LDLSVAIINPGGIYGRKHPPADDDAFSKRHRAVLAVYIGLFSFASLPFLFTLICLYSKLDSPALRLAVFDFHES